MPRQPTKMVNKSWHFNGSELKNQQNNTTNGLYCFALALLAFALAFALAVSFFEGIACDESIVLSLYLNDEDEINKNNFLARSFLFYFINSNVCSPMCV